MTAKRSATGRPEKGEYADYAVADIAAVPGHDAVAALARLAEETPALFESLRSAADRGLTYAPGKWTIKQILGHLIDDERIYATRVLALARGEQGELLGFDENAYAAHGDFDQRSLDTLLEEYRTVRASTLALLIHLPVEAWSRRGRVNGYVATARGLAFHIAGHELHHLGVVRELYTSLGA